jgi:hypothetical protein
VVEAMWWDPGRCRAIELTTETHAMSSHMALGASEGHARWKAATAARPTLPKAFRAW